MMAPAAKSCSCAFVGPISSPPPPPAALVLFHTSTHVYTNACARSETHVHMCAYTCSRVQTHVCACAVGNTGKETRERKGSVAFKDGIGQAEVLRLQREGRTPERSLRDLLRAPLSMLPQGRTFRCQRRRGRARHLLAFESAHACVEARGRACGRTSSGSAETVFAAQRSTQQLKR